MPNYSFDARDKSGKVVWSAGIDIDDILYKTVIISMLRMYQKRLEEHDVQLTVNGYSIEQLRDPDLIISQEALPHRLEPVINPEQPKTITAQIKDKIKSIFRL